MNLFKTKNVIPYVSSKGDKVYPIVMDIKTGIVEGKAIFTTGDIDTAYLYVTILEEQSEYNIMGTTVVCNIQRPDGSTMKIYGDVQGNNLIEFPLGQSGVSQEGIYNFDIAVVFSEKKMVTSPTAQYSVTQSIEVIGDIEEDDRFPVLESLISGISTINEEELVRQSKEEAREQAESTRNSNETARQNQEQARVTAEGNRVTGENVRVSAEQSRVLKEQERQAIEVERQNNESTREQQEATRVSQENVRKQADILRQQEHESRQQFLNGFEGKLNTVVDNITTVKDAVVSVREANKRQDIFLQGLYNENLDGRVTVKEEGSVISLTNSDDGLVDIVGLEGNTLINYVTDGVKELTLNGDIDVEGTDVTITEGVDNGLVDVICEGNTMVNLYDFKDRNDFNRISNKVIINGKNLKFIADGTYQNAMLNPLSTIKPNTTYTIIVNIIKNTLTNGYLVVTNSTTSANLHRDNFNVTPNMQGRLVGTVTTKSDLSKDNRAMATFLNDTSTQGEIEVNIVVLEGDWTNKEIPQSYFEGMKSVAECEDNKIEILSSNSDNTLSNKKEIALSEPLRALPNGVCDKVVKIGGKWYVHRNCGELIVDNNSNISTPPTGSNWDRLSGGGEFKVNTMTFSIPKPNNCKNTWDNGANNTMAISDKFIVYPSTDASAFYDGEKIVFDSSDFKIGINKSKLTSQDVDGFKQWLQTNNIKVIYQLTTPIYELLEIEPTLITYNDITHISNNSTIPCNMKIQNTGYNAIIKPSTQYTVAFDTDISGEVGINLAGTKVTTTNNVATVTTPSTLTDDSLRLSGKGITASNVMLLEGDKTNWIPSYFEGMKSSFEDKLQDDGNYKVDIEVYTKYGTLRGSHSIKPIHSMETKGIEEYLKYFTLVDGYKECNNLYDYYFIGKNDIWVNLGTFNKEEANKVMNKRIAECEGRYSNLIMQLSEPIRGVNDVKDSFVFKDGKLMIERRFSQIKIKDSMVSNIYRYSETEKTIAFRFASMLYPNWHSVSENSRSNLLRKIGSVLHDIEGYTSGDTSSDFYIRINKCKLDELSVDGMRKWLRDNEVVLTYQLIEPIYEEVPYELQKIILEGYLNGTLFIDTNIPPTIEASYTANIPVVSELNKNSNEIGLTQEDLSVTQIAVDFLLMSNIGEEMLSSFNLNTKGRNSMGVYFANRITKGALKYEDVISKYPQYKEEIDSILETK